MQLRTSSNMQLAWRSLFLLKKKCNHIFPNTKDATTQSIQLIKKAYLIFLPHFVFMTFQKRGLLYTAMFMDYKILHGNLHGKMSQQSIDALGAND